MQNGNITLKDLFNADRIFNVPKYQRAYAWKQDNLSDFLEDLLNQRGSKNYFLGTFLFHQKDSRGDYEFVDVVDGQQRLTTIILFMKVAIQRLEKLGSSLVSKKTVRRYVFDDECYKLELENEDNSFLHSRILGGGKVARDAAVESPSQKRLRDALRFFERRLAKLDHAHLEHVYSVLIQSDLIIYVVDQISDATQIFELLNDRGRKLTNLEGVKSFLMYRIGCLDLRSKGEQAVTEIQDNFAAIYRYVEKYELNENDVLRYHTIAFEKSKTDDYKAPELFIKHKVNKMFDADKSGTLIKNTILQYVARLRESFEIYTKIQGNEMQLDSFEQLVMIGRVNPFYPQLMSLYKKDRGNLDVFLGYLIKFTFKSALIGLRNKNEKFYADLRSQRGFIEQFKTVIDDNWWNINVRADDAVNYSNFYEWIPKNMGKYVLFSYENWLRRKKGYPEMSREIFFSDDSRTQLNIEHITAKKCKNLKFDSEFSDQYLNAVGNLVIDSKASNSSKGNRGVDVKSEEYKKAPFMSQNEINNDKIDWADLEQVKEFIKKRDKRLIRFIKTQLM